MTINKNSRTWSNRIKALFTPYASKRVRDGKRVRDVSIYASKNIAQVSILERYFFVSTYQAAGPDTCLAVFVVASLPPCL